MISASEHRPSEPRPAAGRWSPLRAAPLVAAGAALVALLVPGALYAAPRKTAHERADGAGRAGGKRPQSKRRALELMVRPRPVSAREAVWLTLAGATRASSYRWVVRGADGSASRVTAGPHTSWRFGIGGRFTITAMRLQGTRIAAADTVRLTVRSAARRASSARAAASAVVAATSDPAPVRLAAAAAQSVTIKDFSFGPGTLTVNVGDTVTWTNDGPSEHTATANDGSFNTGILSKGQSASHTFTSAGTFQYICSIHTFMHGTIVVEATNTSSSGGSSSSGSTSSSSGSGSSGSGNSSSSGSGSSGSSLPMTGLDVLALAALGGILLGLGTALRRRTRAARNARG